MELEPEVANWLASLDSAGFEVAEAHVDLLAEFGTSLRLPHSRALGEGLFELRFDQARQARRITYWYTPNRVVVLLTTFRKQRNNEQAEIKRARTAMRRCQGEHQP